MSGQTGADLGVGASVVALGIGGVAYADTSDEVGPILAFIGVILVALLTAYWTRRSLIAESDRQVKSLEAERDRQERDLAHARELADTADLRLILAEGLDALDALYQWTLVDTRRPTPLPEAERTERMMETSAGLSRSLNRLRIRLAAEDPLWTCFKLVTEAIYDLVKAHEDDDDAAYEVAQSQYGARYREFGRLATVHVGSRLPPRD